jgi:hypothetical protein
MFKKKTVLSSGHLLSVDLQVLAGVKAVFKEDAGLELNVSKTSILPKGVTQKVMT